MLLNYLKIALRTMLRYRLFSFIHISGLTLGLTSFLAIALYIAHELSYDRFHTQTGQIYRVLVNMEFDGNSFQLGSAPNILAPSAARELPAVQLATRYFHHNFGELAFVAVGDEKFSEPLFYYADPTLFDIFTIPFVEGSPEGALDLPGKVVLSESTAKRYFPGGDPLGKVITIDQEIELTVTGVYQDFPANSSLQANAMASFASHWFGREGNESWGNASFPTYLLLQPEARAQAVAEDLNQLIVSNLGDDAWFKVGLQPLADVHLLSNELTGSTGGTVYGDMAQVRLLAALALAILLIAAINYMNLTTAQAQHRYKEVGIAKTLGATFGMLSWKFFVEAGLFVGVAMGLSLLIFASILPYFNTLSGVPLTLDFLALPAFWLLALAVWGTLTFLAGVYPAFYLSSYTPQAAMRKKPQMGWQLGIRKGLVVFQFAVSMVLIIGTVGLYAQMAYIKNRNLGYEPEQVIAIMTTAANSSTQINGLVNGIGAHPDVVALARSQSFPGMGTSMRNLLREGETGEGSALMTCRATAPVMEVLGIRLLAGNSLPLEKERSDTTIQVVVNQAIARYLGHSPEDLVGRLVNIAGFSPLCEVVGVMDDFHNSSLHQPMQLFCYHNAPTEGYSYLLVKVKTTRLTDTMAELENTFLQHIPAAFSYTFLDEHLAGLYQSEKRMSGIVGIFSGMAIFIACLGLYALVAFITEMRKREIGVRKILGASATQLVRLLSREFLGLIGLAIVLGAPLGHWLLVKWLEGFAYKVTITPTLWILAGSACMAIAMCTVGIELWKATRANPVHTLKSEG